MSNLSPAQFGGAAPQKFVRVGYESGDTVHHKEHGTGEIEFVDPDGTANVQYHESGANMAHPKGTLSKRKPKDDDWGAHWNVKAPK